ncbi:MAG: glycosyltransferase family 39 protein [Anaerolineae bacterium]|nr:glycosyltransferase family 39 protein [Anaerolineae bacterium]
MLAGFMKIVGLGFAQARLFHALVSLATVGVVTVTGIRHFGWRVGVLAGGVLSLLAIGLQFARVTTESTPTALCWAISMLSLLRSSSAGKL